MKKLLGLLAPLIVLTACSPNEVDFKSAVPTTPRDDVAFAANAIAPLDKLMNDPSEDVIVPDKKSTEDLIANSTDEPSELPAQINLDVPFYPQAPDADWGMPWQEACEEASIVLGYYYIIGEPLSKEKFKEEVLGLVEWQKEHYGDYIHTSTAQNAEMLQDYFGYENFEILENPTVDDMKKALAGGHPILAPFAGRVMENPFFSGEGPYYHVIIIKGYDGKNFITNDVGTRRGHNFIYSYKNTMDALHDYDSDKDILEGAKNMIILK